MLSFNKRIEEAATGTTWKNQQLHKKWSLQRKVKVIVGELSVAGGDTVPSFPALCLAIPDFSFSSFHSVFRIGLVTSCSSVFSKSTRNMTTWLKYGHFGKARAWTFWVDFDSIHFWIVQHQRFTPQVLGMLSSKLQTFQFHSQYNTHIVMENVSTACIWCVHWFSVQFLLVSSLLLGTSVVQFKKSAFLSWEQLNQCLSLHTVYLHYTCSSYSVSTL